MVLVSTGSGRELNRGSTRQSSSGLRQSKNRPCTGAVPELGTAKSGVTAGWRPGKTRIAHGFQQVARQMSQWISSLKLETGSVSEQRKHLAVSGRVQGRNVAGRNRLGLHPDPATRTAQVLRSTCGLTRTRSVSGSHCRGWTRIVWSAHTIFAKAIGAWTMVGSARKGQGRQYVQSTRMSVRLCGAAAETSRLPKLNS